MRPAGVHRFVARCVLERLGDAIGATVRISLIYGEPVEREGITVIPVAKARWGFGGRVDALAQAERADTRAGGGLVLTPIGYIEVQDGASRFRPIYDPAAFLPPVLLIGGIALLLVRALAKALRS